MRHRHVAPQGGREGHRKAALVAQHCRRAVPLDAVDVAVIADGEPERFLIPAQHAADGIKVVPEGLFAVEHERTARLRRVAGKVGRFLQHEPGEIVVSKVQGALGEVWYFFAERPGIVQRIRAPEHHIEGAGHAGDALPFHGCPDLIDALRGLQVHIHPVQRVEKVRGIVVPAQMQDGTGICHNLEMIFKEHSVLLSSFVGLGLVGFPAGFPLLCGCGVVAVVEVLDDVGITLPVVAVGSRHHLCSAGSGHG